MRRFRNPIILGLSFAALLISGCTDHGWVVQRYPADSNSNIAASDRFGAALLAPDRAPTGSQPAVAAAASER